MPSFHASTALTISGAFVFGLVLALLGSLKLALAKRLNIGEGRVGMLLSALSFALIPMMLLAGVLLDRWSVQGVMILGSVLLAVGILALSVGSTYYRAFGAILVAGFGAAAVSTVSIVLMPTAFWPNDPPSASLNLGNVFFALGALVTPVLVDVLLRLLDMRRTLFLVALLCLIPALIAALARASELSLHDENPDLEAVLRHPYLWLAGLVFFFYAPLEGSISIWATTFLTDLGHGERRAAWLLSGFWTTFMASRLLVAFGMHAGYLSANWDGPLLVLPALLAGVVLGNLSGSARPQFARTGLLLLGFLLGPIFPTLVGMVFHGFPHGHGTAYGVMFAIGSLGSLILAPIIGASARRRTVQTALRIPMVIALILTGVALLFSLAPPPSP
jgi:fucose permease